MTFRFKPDGGMPSTGTIAHDQCDTAEAIEVPPEEWSASERRWWRAAVPLGNALPKPEPKAVTWTNNDERWHALERWGKAIAKSDLSHVLAIKLAWRLAALVRQRGYAYPSDAHLAKELGVSIRKAQLALKRLADIGAIFRRQVQGQRRIFLSESFAERVLKNASNRETATPVGRDPRRSFPYVRPPSVVQTYKTKDRPRHTHRFNGMTAREIMDAEDAVDPKQTRH